MFFLENKESWKKLLRHKMKPRGSLRLYEKFVFYLFLVSILVKDGKLATILRELYVELIFFVSKYEIAVVQQAGKLNSLQSEILHQL